MNNFEVAIGLEIHAQLLTRSKLFCPCSASFGGEPNERICPVCMGVPGALPVLNRRAVEYAIKMGLALHCSISQGSVFARKNYFYPDCPKNYQITQYELPLASGGYLEPSETSRKIRIRRIHLEEDAAKLIHDESGRWSYVDMNRSGVPLIEIVTEPDIRTPGEASSFVEELRAILQYLEVCDGNMEEGSLRCDVNVSLAEEESKSAGIKTEIKNLNSLKAIERALELEIDRQSKLLSSGEAIEQVTLLWQAEGGGLSVMRSKEDAPDYRYFPEPDLLVLELPGGLVEKLRSMLPELPREKARRFVAKYALPPYDAKVLTARKDVAHFFEAVTKESGDAKSASNWVMGELLRELKNHGDDLEELKITPENLAKLISYQQAGRISMLSAKEVFKAMCESGRSPDDIIKAKKLEKISDEKLIEEIARRLLDAHKDEVDKYRRGKGKVLNYFLGLIMRETGGRADPVTAENILMRLLRPIE